MTTPPVLIVGAGISGLACARALTSVGIGVRVIDRGRAPGGRMSSRTLHGRPVDLGAAVVDAASDSPFRPVVDDWVARGLLRAWAGRFAAAGGTRSLLVDLARDLDVVPSQTVERVEPGFVDGVAYDAVVLAMPDPQARRLLGSATSDTLTGAALGELADALAGEWEPTISVVLGWDSPQWNGDLGLVELTDSPDITLIADDGARRGDGSPVLVAHSTASLARRHLDDPDAAITPVADAVARALDIRVPPAWTHAHRWTYARPIAAHPEPFLLSDGIGVCGDGWGGGAPTVEAAWLSGDALGRALIEVV